MKEIGLTIASYPLTGEALTPLKIWGFKLNETFIDLLLSIQVTETPNRKYPGYLAGRTALKAVISHHPKEVIQFHANLEVIKKNQNYWFYTHEPIEINMAAAYINEWLRKECQAKKLAFTPMEWQDWGTFEELSLNELLDKERFKNGYGVLERYFLLQLTKQSVDFINNTTLQFYPVIAEGRNFIMTTPYFFPKRGPLSFAIESKIQQIPNQKEPLLEFNTQVKLWVQENPIHKKRRYFSAKQSTSVYLYNSESIEGLDIVFNQIPLKLKNEELILVNKADQYYCEQMDIQISTLLDKELHSFELNPTNHSCQTLLTVPTDARSTKQTLEGRKQPVSHAAYGLGLQEIEVLFEYIAKTLSPFKLTHLLPMLNCSKGITVMMMDLEKAIIFPQYEMEDLLITEEEHLKALELEEITKQFKLTKTTKVSKKPYQHRSKNELTIGYATTSRLMEAALKGNVRLLLRADTEISENTYVNENNLKVRFVKLPLALAEPFSDKPLSSELGRRSQLVKEMSTGLDAAFIEIEPMKDQKKDSKHFLRTEFAKYGIPLQFIHPSEESSVVKVKNDLINRGKACARDLLSKTGCIESELQTIFKQNEEKTILSVSRIILKNSVKLPCLTKVTAEDSWIKVYPEEQWVKIEDLSKQFSHSYIENIKSLWNKKYEDHLPLVQQWLKNALKEFSETKDLLIYWDETVETLLPIFDLSEFDKFIKNFLPFGFNRGLLIRWKSAIHAPDYVNRKQKTSGIELGKFSGIYQSPLSNRCYYLIGDRGENAQGKKDTLKLTSPGKTLTMPGMHQCYLYPELPSEEAVKALQLTQSLRRMVITQNITAAVPYPLYLVRHLNEHIESFAIRYVPDEKKTN